MNAIERAAVRHYLDDYPHDWSFKRIIDHLYYEYEETPEVKLRDLYEECDPVEIAQLVSRAYVRLAEGV